MVGIWPGSGGGDGLPDPALGFTSGLDQPGDSVGESVRGVVVRQRALSGGPLQEVGCVVASAGEPGEARGEDGQARIAGGGWRGLGDAGCPFTDAGLRVFELVVKVTLMAPFGGAAAGGPGGP